MSEKSKRDMCQQMLRYVKTTLRWLADDTGPFMTELGIQPVIRNGANDIELAYKDMSMSCTVSLNMFVLDIYFNKELQTRFPDGRLGVRFRISRQHGHIPAMIAREFLVVGSDCYPDFLEKNFPNLTEAQHPVEKMLDALIDDERPKHELWMAKGGTAA